MTNILNSSGEKVLINLILLLNIMRREFLINKSADSLVCCERLRRDIPVSLIVEKTKFREKKSLY